MDLQNVVNKETPYIQTLEPSNANSDPLCRLFAASIDIHGFLLTERDLSTLLQGLCDRLVISGMFKAVWMLLPDETISYAITAESGLGDRLALVKEQLQKGSLPNCGRLALENNGICVVFPECNCGVCSDGQRKRKSRTIALGLQSGKQLYGFLALEAEPHILPNAEERALLEKTGTAIATTLARLFGGAERDKSFEELQISETRFKLALQATDAGLWDWNLQTGEMYTSPYQKEFLKNSGNGDDAQSWQTLIHPDDKKKVVSLLHDHLAGKTEDYQAEYRICDKDGTWRWFKDRGRVVEWGEKNLPLRMIGTHQDITEEKRKDVELAKATEKLHNTVRSERRFLQSVIDGAGDPVMVIDMEYNILLINSTAAKIMDVDPGKAPGQKCYRLFHQTDTPLCKKQCPCPVDAVSKEQGNIPPLEHHQLHGNNIKNTFELEVSPLYDQDGSLAGIIEVAHNIEDRLRIEEELRHSKARYFELAHHDALTGLPNRLLFHDRLKQSMIKARRKNSRVAVLFLDLDRFKQINDTLGHDVGDELLIEVADRLENLVRKSDTVARLGGDEFVCVLDDITNINDAATVGRKILVAMEQPITAGGRELYISTSIGLAFYPDDGDNLEGVLKCADTALYKAKDEGRANYQFYTADMNSRAHSLLQLETALRKARGEKRFIMHYQGQFDLKTGHLTGMEALIRWNHPEMGLMMPCDFIALAEEIGIIVSLGEWVVETVGEQIVSWQKEGLPVVPVAINISARQIQGNDFSKLVADVLEKTGLAPELLVIEITEGEVMHNLEASRAELLKISNMGVQIALDDFGTGSSSLASLKQLPIDRLKIDRSFIKDVCGDKDSAMIARAIIGLGRNLGMEIVAQGIERREEADFFRDNDCNFVQGFLYGHPLPASNVADMLLKNNGVKN